MVVENKSLIDALRGILSRVEAGQVDGIYVGVMFDDGDFGSLIAVAQDCNLFSLLGHTHTTQDKIKEYIDPSCVEDTDRVTPDTLDLSSKVVDIRSIVSKNIDGED